MRGTSLNQSRFCSFLLALFATGAAAHREVCAAVADEKPAHDMVLVPAGEFLMGTSPEEAQRLAQEYHVHPTLFLGESPQRKVSVRAFWIDRCPVTNAQYKRFIDATNRHPPYGWKGREFPPGVGEHPVTCVGWQDADAYAQWAGLRLPT
jgi:gamma-glutamyl hercynylcysteine S-oxide synthase